MQSVFKNLFRKRLAADLLHVFHREGVESFSASRAVFNHYTDGTGRRLFVIHLRCGKPLHQIRAFRGLFHPEPWLEVVFDRPLVETGLSSGQVLAMPIGYDYERHENITNFLYVSHQSIEKIEMTVAYCCEDKARFRFIGITGAAHGSCDTKITFDIEFGKEPGLRRSFN